MSANRYGQIWHGDHHHINIRFPSNEARLKFQNEFEAYHASHDHEGDVPIFKCVTTKDLKLSTGSRSSQDLVKAETDKDYRITLDGYSWNEIHEYHNPSGWSDYFWYSVPTCCVPPTIVVDREFVDSGTLKRHELSAKFEDMPEKDFQSLLESVQTNDFIDPIVRIYEGHILDGWHRYRAAQELNLIRKLRFQEWDDDADRDGDPRSFVLARNLNRRHLTPAQRAQIVLEFNDWAPRGRPSKNTPNGVLKTKKELAKEARVGTSTMDRAASIKESGQSEVVIRGDKTPGQLEREAKEKRYAKLCKAINAFNRVWQKTQLATQVSLSDDFFPAAAEALGFPMNTVEQVYRCQDSPESEKKMKGFTGLGIDSWERYFDAMRTALIEKPEWVESLENKTNTEDALEHLYQNRQNFQTAVSDFAQSGAYLDFAYCRRRIKSLVGLEDSTDEESTDCTQWDLQKIKAQSHLITETVQVIRGYLEEDPKIETHPVAELLSEMQRISEIHQSAKLDTYTPPFLHQPLSDAVERIEKLWTSDWEAKSDEARLDDLNALEAELPSLIEAEDTARETDGKTGTSAAGPAPDDLKTLWEKVSAEIPKWKQRYKESGKQESELISRASKSQFIHVLREYRETEQGGAATIEELKDLLQLLKNDSYPIAYRLRRIVRPEQPEQELSNSEAIHRYANSVIDAFRNILRGLHVVDVDEFLDEILHFFQGIDSADMCVATEAQLKSIVDLFQPLLTQEVAVWPEFIRNHRWIPKRELVLVSIGISNNTDDEFEMVEFTDESSDEIRCDLNALPEDLRTALLKLASEQIYAEAVKEFDTDDS